MRLTSYGKEKPLTSLDLVGSYLSQKNLNKTLRKISKTNSMADIGCGYNAELSRKIRKKFNKCYLADISLNSNLTEEANVEILEGPLEKTLKQLKNQNVDFILANNIIEHLNDPLSLLKELKRIISNEGLIYINVPSWRGKFFLEIAAFKLKIAPEEEMQDHKNYYSKNELWTLIRHAGFSPKTITVQPKKFGLNTFALIQMSRM